MDKLIIDGTEIEVLDYNKSFEKAYIQEVSKPMPKPLETVFIGSYIKRLKKYYENYEAKVFVYPHIKITVSSCSLKELCKIIYSKNEYVIENEKYYLAANELMNLYNYLKFQNLEYLELNFLGIDGSIKKEKLPKSIQEKNIEELIEKFGMRNCDNEKNENEIHTI